MILSRRDFLSAALLAPAAFSFQRDARLLGVVPLGNPGGFPTAPFGRLLGTGLDARLFTDLAELGAKPSPSLVTPSDRFFVRTAFPATFDPAAPWSIRVGGLVKAPIDVPLRGINDLGTSSGRYLIECSGNADQSNYG